MAVKHISDSEFQDYLDGTAGKKKKLIKKHLRSCTQCRVQFNAYKFVYKELYTEPQVQFSGNLADRIISETVGCKSISFGFWDYMVLVFSLLLVISATAVFFFTGPFRAVLSGVIGESWQELSNFIMVVFKDSPVIPLAAALVLVICSYLDRKFIIGRRKEA